MTIIEQEETSHDKFHYDDTDGLYPEWNVAPSSEFLKFLDDEVKQK